MIEHTIVLGADRHLVATLTTPAGSQPPPMVAVLTNSGVIPRSGPHRMNVHLARRFAALGIPSIRFDMSGLGDSRRASGSLPAVQQWVADTRAAMDTAQAQFGCDRFLMVGFCSGAEVAHLVGLEDTRLRAALLWDLYAYPTLQSRLRSLLYRVRRAGPRAMLQKLGQRLAGLLQRGSAAAGETTEAVVVSTAPAKPEFAGRVRRLVDRGMELMFMYSGGEPVWFNYRGQFRDSFGRCGFVDRVAFDMLEDADHLLTRAPAQQAFIDSTLQWLHARVLPRHGTA
ncbi:serine aminopeptidase domain-containing protein [Ideonella sp. BN130291]|uniref:serine aminopeptidase domain-containing protein n=1 Tax=Ideonella sp. BN130291 TaxID=3112940 RepID=UPI002E253BB6|nr:alpha/beta hydrolase [Ideonella sp. BN130291]